jgi:amino acid transporter
VPGRRGNEDAPKQGPQTLHGASPRGNKRGMNASGEPTRASDRLRERSIGLPQVLFQSITAIAPAVGVAFTLLVAVPHAGPALPLSVLLAVVACLFVASSIGQLAKQVPSAGGLYSYVARSLGPAAGFMTGWTLLLFLPIAVPALGLVFAWAMADVFQNDVGWGYADQWWIWLVLAITIVVFLVYRDVRLSTGAGILLGVFELGVVLALALWMVLSNLDGLTLQVFNPDHATEGTVTGTFKGMVFAILALIGFEAAAPLGEEARNPRWTVPRAVVLSALIIGLFYVLASYGWVLGTGFDDFVAVATAPDNPNPWRELATTFWAGGWVLLFLAIVNSALASANAVVTAATRIMYAMGRNGVLPRAFAHTHPVHLTPHVAIAAQTVFAFVLALAAGFAWGPVTGFVVMATTATILIILIFMTVCIATVAFYLRQRRSEFNVLLHLVFPLLGVAALVGPLYYEYSPLPPYPERYANWVALAWIALGLGVTAWMSRRRRAALEGAARVFVGEEPAGGTPEFRT